MATVALCAEPRGATRFTAPEIGIVVFLLLLLAFGFVYAIRRLAAERSRERQQELVFEQSVLLALSKPVSTAPVPGPSAETNLSDLWAAPEPETSKENQAIPALTEPQLRPSPLDDPCLAVLRQLQGSGMVESVEGYVEMHGNPRMGTVLRMRGAKRVLLLPFHETEAFVRHNLRRYDYMIFVGNDGKGGCCPSSGKHAVPRLWAGCSGCSLRRPEVPGDVRNGKRWTLLRTSSPGVDRQNHTAFQDEPALLRS